MNEFVVEVAVGTGQADVEVLNGTEQIDLEIALLTELEVMVVTRAIRVTAADFTGTDYVNSKLVNKVAQIDFDVWTAGGSGTLMNVDDGYEFDGVTGTITTDPDKYVILLY